MTPNEVLDTLLPSHPSFFEHLRNGVAWPELNEWNRLEHLRHVVLASADKVQLLCIDYHTVGRRLTSKFQRVAMGKKLRTIVFQDVDFVNGLRISPSVKEVRFEIAAPSTGYYGRMLGRDLWEEFQPADPVPQFESVSFGFSPRTRWEDGAFYRHAFSTFDRGDSFFQAFPHATKLNVLEQPNPRFVVCFHL
jgi:hypothetical protein